VIPNYIDVEIQTILSDMQGEFEWLANQKNLKFLISGTQQVVHTDAELLKTILRNLISNAIRYTEEGVIKIDCFLNGNKLRMSIIDTGIGINSEDIEKIFDDYYQVEKSNPRIEKGLGLGLAIVRRLEKLLGYQLTVTSTPSQGTKFEFDIPLLPERRSV
jgi:signal transduction histidine kinase